MEMSQFLGSGRGGVSRVAQEGCAAGASRVDARDAFRGSQREAGQLSHTAFVSDAAVAKAEGEAIDIGLEPPELPPELAEPF